MLTIIAAVLLFLSVWIIVPAPSVWLLPLGVLAPEISPILLALAVIVMLLSLRKLTTRKVGILFALIAAGISAMPLSKLPAVERQFDRELARAFPSAAKRPLPENARPQPLVIRDLFLGVSAGDVRVDRALNFATRGIQRLALDAYRPTGSAPFPVLVQIHGGEWQRGNRTDNETFARYFASRGYIVYAIEYRHAPRSPWPAAFDDVRAALAWIQAQSTSMGGDPQRLAVVGRSSGAQLALLAAYSSASPVAAVVSYYGPSDLTKGWREPPDPDPMSMRSILEAFLGGTLDAVPERYRDASPIAHVSAAGPPTLLIHGARDHVVLPGMSRDLHARLQAVGARSMLLEIPWADHAFDTLPNGLSGQVSLYYTERFLAAALARGR